MSNRDSRKVTTDQEWVCHSGALWSQRVLLTRGERDPAVKVCRLLCRYQRLSSWFQHDRDKPAGQRVNRRNCYLPRCLREEKDESHRRDHRGAKNSWRIWRWVEKLPLKRSRGKTMAKQLPRAGDTSCGSDSKKGTDWKEDKAFPWFHFLESDKSRVGWRLQHSQPGRHLMLGNGVLPKQAKNGWKIATCI